jgi:hypothetical protein
VACSKKLSALADRVFTIKAILSFILGAGLLFLGFNWLMPMTTHKVLEWGLAEGRALLSGSGEGK